jgi:hypothetical protein
LLIDLAERFQPLDRATLLRDFVHFSNDGYRLIAGWIADVLIRAGWVQAEAPADLDALHRRYVRPAGTDKP